MSKDERFKNMSKEERKESEEILEDMKEDGIEIEDEPKEEPPKEEVKPEVKPKDQEKKETPKPEKKETPEPKEEPKPIEGEGDKKPDKVKPEAKSDRKPDKGRTIKTVPYGKYKDLKTKVKDLEKQVEGINASGKTDKKKDEDIDKVVSKLSSELAGELGVEPDKLKGVFDKLSEAIISKTKLPDDVVKTLAKAKENEAWKEEEKLFDEQFEAFQEEYPDEKISKEKIKELAFNSEHAKKSLYEIYFRHIKPYKVPKKKSSESAKGGTSKEKGGKALKDMTEAEAVKLSDKDFDAWGKLQEKGFSKNKVFDDKGNRV